MKKPNRLWLTIKIYTIWRIEFQLTLMKIGMMKKLLHDEKHN